MREPKPTSFNTLRARRSCSSLENPAYTRGKATFLRADRTVEEIKALKYKANQPIAYIGKLVVRLMTDESADQPVFALRWAIKAAEEIHEGRFPGT